MPYYEGDAYFTGQPTEFIIDSFCPKNRLVAINAREGAGKSKFALAMAYAVTTGTKFLSLDTQQGHVLWYNLDNVFPNDIHERCLELGKGDDTWVKDVTWFDGELNLTGNYDPKTQKAEYHRIIDKANSKGTKLIVFDTLAALLVGAKVNEMLASETEPFMLDLLKVARKTDACVVVLHHMPKDIENLSGRGSTAIAAKVDQEFIFKPGSSMM